ncbi:hypothetical protein ACHQM5_028896 [Ranunculus cassubicifolius]
METSFPFRTLLVPKQTSTRNRAHNLFQNPNKINVRNNFAVIVSPRKISVINVEVATTSSDPAQVELTWEIIVGAIAGVTPFVVAGIEFSKRIVAQRQCQVCGGSGLVKREKYYFRCPKCGGFLPWQSWEKFFKIKVK